MKNKPWIPAIVGMLVLANLLSGCFGIGDDGADPGLPTQTGGGNETEEPPELNITDPGPDLPSLADFTCDYLYPDNETPIPCENQFENATIAGAESKTTVSDGWVCASQYPNENPGDFRFLVFWHSTDEKNGLYWEHERLEGPIHGIIYSRAQDDRGTPADELQGFAWNGGSGTGFVEFPAIEKSDASELNKRANIRFYTIGFETDTPALADAEVRVDWSYFGRSAYPVVVLETASETYYFNEPAIKTHGGTGDSYHLRPFTIDGDDFQLSVTAAEFETVPFAWREPAHRPGCALVSTGQ